LHACLHVNYLINVIIEYTVTVIYVLKQIQIFHSECNKDNLFLHGLSNIVIDLDVCDNDHETFVILSLL